jgi:hypothetical protein
VFVDGKEIPQDTISSISFEHHAGNVPIVVVTLIGEVEVIGTTAFFTTQTHASLYPEREQIAEFYGMDDELHR